MDDHSTDHIKHNAKDNLNLVSKLLVKQNVIKRDMLLATGQNLQRTDNPNLKLYLSIKTTTSLKKPSM